MIYYDPDGHFLKEILDVTKKIGMKAVALVHATGEIAFDAGYSLGALAWTTGTYIGSGIGVVGNYAAYQLGLTSDDTFNTLHNTYLENFSKSKETLTSMPSNVYKGIVNNVATTFNWDKFVNYLTTDDYNESKNYSKSVIQTGLTVFGGAKILQSAGGTLGQIASSIKYNPSPALVTAEGLTFSTSSIGSFSVDVAAINQAIINGVQSIGINASLIVGGNSGGNSSLLKEKQQLKKISNNKQANEIAKKYGYDNAEEFKESIVGKGNVKRFNIKYNPKTQEIFLESISGGKQIPTGYYTD
jgi:hypothetical protein